MRVHANSDWIAWLLESDQEIFTQSRYRNHAAFITHGMEHIQLQAQNVRKFLQDLRDEVTHFHEVDTELALQQSSETLQRLLPGVILQIALQTQLKIHPAVINESMRIDAQQPLNGNYMMQQITVIFMLVCHDPATFNTAVHIAWPNFFNKFFSQTRVILRITLADLSSQLNSTCYLLFVV